MRSLTDFTFVLIVAGVSVVATSLIPILADFRTLGYCSTRFRAVTHCCDRRASSIMIKLDGVEISKFCGVAEHKIVSF